MPEGHTLHRLARLHQRRYAGAPVRVSSPQGRFAAASVDGVEPSLDTIVAETYAGSRAMFMYVNTERARSNPAMFSFVDGFRRSVDESWSITTLVAPPRQANARKYMSLPEMKF